MSRTGGVPGWDVLVCRGCCCGSARKHRRTDHEAQLDELRAASAEGGAVRLLVSDCLDQCDRSNVVLLRPDRAARRAGGKPLWLGEVLTSAQTLALGGWLRRGGPAAEGLPNVLHGLRFRPTGR